MAQTMFSIDNVTYPHIRVLSCTQSFDVLDKDSYRALSGEMNRNIIGTYYNYKLKLKPEKSEDGMEEYSKLFYVLSAPQESHTITVPFDCDDEGGTHTTKTYTAYVTSGKRNMLKYNVNGIDYWGEAEIDFIAMDKAR